MIDGYIVGDAEVIRRFETIGTRLRDELRAGVNRATIKLQTKVKQDKLSGQVLKVRTGRLRRSIQQDVFENGGQVVGVVSTNVKYAPVHEYGFAGVVTVRDHLRMQKKAFGKSISPREVEVRSHPRKVNLPERSFLRSSLREMESSGAIRVEFDAAVERATT